MSDTSPAAICALTKEGNIVNVPVTARRKVCYEFDTRITSAGLAMPYAVEINGHVESIYARKPRALTAQMRQINLQVAPGSKVALYLNSDAHPDFRQHPVYALTVSERDVLVQITERLGRNGHDTATLGTPVCRSASNGPAIDKYEAALTGDIWMVISHLYTAEEAGHRISDHIDPAIRQAVLSIYKGLPHPELSIELPSTSPQKKVRLHFQESDNVRATTTDCPLLTGVLPRTHPRAFEALIVEALETGVTDVQVTSCWRPMLGSIVHRAGLGLDITHIENLAEHVHLNRTALTKPGSQSGENVSTEERELYQAYETARIAAEASERELNAAKNRLASNRDSSKVAELNQSVEAANATVQIKRAEEIAAKKKMG